MNDDGAELIERAVDLAAAFLFALAAACCAWLLGVGTAGAAAAGLAGFACCFVLLRAVAAEERTFVLQDFAVAHPSPAPDELLLTELVKAPAEPPATELLLDDALDEPESDTRVVQLFDAASMPTPEELRARIERHLEKGTAPAPPQDAAQALHNALAELRRSLR